MKIYIAVVCDHHYDDDIQVFTNLISAMEYCKDSVPRHKTLTVKNLNTDMVNYGWRFYGTYGIEGDYVYVLERRLKTTFVEE